jgi:hypothetical protein
LVIKTRLIIVLKIENVKKSFKARSENCSECVFEHIKGNIKIERDMLDRN